MVSSFVRTFSAIVVVSAFAATDALAERGIASLYAHSFKGRKTASGERFDPGAMTCAHKHHAFGTMLRVTLDSKSIVCEVTDRGPFVRGRIIDLTPTAARTLGFKGLARVSIEKIQGPLPRDAAPAYALADNGKSRPVALERREPAIPKVVAAPQAAPAPLVVTPVVVAAAPQAAPQVASIAAPPPVQVAAVQSADKRQDRVPQDPRGESAVAAADPAVLRGAAVPVERKKAEPVVREARVTEPPAPRAERRTVETPREERRTADRQTRRVAVAQASGTPTIGARVEGFLKSLFGGGQQKRSGRAVASADR